MLRKLETTTEHVRRTRRRAVPVYYTGEQHARFGTLRSGEMPRYFRGKLPPINDSQELRECLARVSQSIDSSHRGYRELLPRASKASEALDKVP